MYVERLLSRQLLRLFETFPVVAVTGARQVGKSTLLQHLFGQKADCVVFDPVLDVENARRDPDLFLDNHRTPLIVDEIQYAPELVAAIKRRVDRHRAPGQYLLTGSQQWGVLRSLAESLAGRVVFLDLEGFCLAEIARTTPARSWLAAWMDSTSDFLKAPHPRLPSPVNLYEQLWRGYLPEAQFLPLEAIPDFQAAYLRTYIERDVRLQGDVSDWQLFGRFVRLTAALTAQEVNQSHLGREIGLNPQTARRWLDMLTATFQWHEVPAYAGSAVKRVSGRPKGYIQDTGTACAAQAVSTPAVVGGHPLWGALFETAVEAEIRKLCVVMSPPPHIYHWRSYSGAEVDLLLERDGRFFPIEVKAKSRPDRRDTSGIEAFRRQHPNLQVERGLVICPGETVIPLSERDVAIPWDLRE